VPPPPYIPLLCGFPTCLFGSFCVGSLLPNPPPPPSPQERVKTISDLSKQLQQARATAKLQGLKLTEIAGGSDHKEVHENLEKYMRRSLPQTIKSHESCLEEQKGMGIQGMDGIVKEWFRLQGPSRREALLEDLFGVHICLSSKTSGGKENEMPADFMSTCGAAAMSLKKNGVANLVYLLAKAASTEKFKEDTFMHDTIQTFCQNLGTKGPTGNRYLPSVIEFAETNKNKSTKGPYSVLESNLPFPKWRHLQQLLQKKGAKRPLAGVDEETIEYLKKTSMDDVFAVQFDESKLNDTSVGKEGESNWGGLAKFDFDERQEYLKKRKEDGEFHNNEDNQDLLGALQRFGVQLERDRTAIRCDIVS
jgi:hypothetical protein